MEAETSVSIVYSFVYFRWNVERIGLWSLRRRNNPPVVNGVVRTSIKNK